MRTNQDNLREQVKLCKVYNNISYIYWSEQLGITKNSFYNWLHEAYNLSEAKAAELEDIVLEAME